MITPDTIITADLLAGLNNCPFCGAVDFHRDQSYIVFACGREINAGCAADYGHAEQFECLKSVEKTLRGRLRDLERELAAANEKLAKMAEVGNQLEYAASKRGTWAGSRLDQAITAWNSLT